MQKFWSLLCGNWHARHWMICNSTSCCPVGHSTTQRCICQGTDFSVVHGHLNNDLLRATDISFLFISYPTIFQSGITRESCCISLIIQTFMPWQLSARLWGPLSHDRTLGICVKREPHSPYPGKYMLFSMLLLLLYCVAKLTGYLHSLFFLTIMQDVLITSLLVINEPAVYRRPAATTMK